MSFGGDTAMGIFLVYAGATGAAIGCYELFGWPTALIGLGLGSLWLGFKVL